MKKIFFLTFCCISLLLLPAVSKAYDEPTYYGLDETAAQAGLQQPAEAPTIIGNVIGNALTLIGVIFFVLMVYGGFLWMTAHGDSGQVDKAKETIMAAVIGMIVVLGSYSLTQFILSAPTGGTSAPAANIDTGTGPTGAKGCCIYMDPNEQIKKATYGNTQDSCNSLCNMGMATGCKLVEVDSEALCNVELGSIDFSICQNDEECNAGMSCVNGECVAQ